MVQVGKVISLFCLGWMFLLPGHSQAQTAQPASSADLQKIITQLNTAATRFSGAQADFTWDQYQSVVDDPRKQPPTSSRKTEKTRPKSWFSTARKSNFMNRPSSS
jgi:hypothetical protein